jgi:putative ABC transport system ATP-binding protein
MGETQVFALQGVSLELSPGQFTVIMGPSGSGKSTLMHLAGSLDVPTSGMVSYRGVNLAELPPRARADFRSSDVGFVFQKYNLVANLTAIENVTLPLLLRNVPTKIAQSRATEALAMVGLEDRMTHRPSKLSGGEQQRVAIARALINHPSMILADEPTGNLDTTTGERILQLLTTFVEGDKLVLVVTHNPEIADLADCLVVLRDGMIEAKQLQEVASR